MQAKVQFKVLKVWFSNNNSIGMGTKYHKAQKVSDLNVWFDLEEKSKHTKQWFFKLILITKLILLTKIF